MLVLASQSPRRRELLRLYHIPFDTESAELDEKTVEARHLAEGPAAVVEALARAKAEAVLEERPNDIILGSDTVVVLDGKILGKPEDAQDAIRMLESLCGREHRVLTAVAILSKEKERVFHEETRVHFYPADARTRQQIRAYVAGGSPLDKAGGYGIQDEGALLIEGIEGDYYTVMGWPLGRAWRELQGFI